MKRKRIPYQKRRIRILMMVVIMAAIIKVLDVHGSSDSSPDYPDYKLINLDEEIEWEKVYEGEISEEEIQTLFYQTGLGIEGIKGVRKECGNVCKFRNEIIKYQIQLFRGEGEKKVVDLEEGDVLVSMSQRLCYYPHGHAAIVIDSENNLILEARSYKAGSCICGLKKWSKLSSFVVLRLKKEVVDEFIRNGNDNPTKDAAKYAAENLDGLKYSLLKDVRPLSNETPEYTQCAHLVWYSYYAVGIDIDENRGLIVKPKDFLKSDALEVVQVFGICPEKLMDLRNE